MVTAQLDLFGGSVVAGDLVARLTAILEQYPDARDSYRVMIVHYWLAYDGLGHVLGEEKTEAFVEWFTHHASSMKTLQNRGMEIQRLRHDLEATPETLRLRKAQSKAGPIRY